MPSRCALSRLRVGMAAGACMLRESREFEVGVKRAPAGCVVLRICRERCDDSREVAIVAKRQQSKPHKMGRRPPMLGPIRRERLFGQALCRGTAAWPEPKQL